MKEESSFTDVLNEYVKRSVYRPSQLARLTGLPPMTIVNWLNGRVQQPRHWQDVVRMGKVPRLSLVEMDSLLQAAGFPCVVQLGRFADGPAEQEVLAFWA
ncbi:MAG: hypothetical protein H6658_21400 [Ardenticatenaceae bacterium]|nr:hypothetical protein [Ardenticatenaceae bacterium]